MMEPALNHRHTPQISLTEALATIDRSAEPVGPSERDLQAAAGYTLAADAGAGAGPALRPAGARLRRVDVALLTAAGVARVDLRVPKFMIVRSDREHLDSTCAMIAGAIESEGGVAEGMSSSLEAALNIPSFDAIVGIGRDAAVRALGKIGQIDFDGVALSPGPGIAYGNLGGRPVLILPDQFDAALAGWLAVGRRLLARLAFRLIEDQPFLLELARPIASTRGRAEIVAVRRRAAQAEPLPNEWTPQTIARADGWILVPAESEGLAAGSKVAVRLWP